MYPSMQWGSQGVVCIPGCNGLGGLGGGCISECNGTDRQGVYPRMQRGRQGCVCPSMQAGGTHPTGMHPCYIYILLYITFYRKQDVAE